MIKSRMISAWRVLPAGPEIRVVAPLPRRWKTGLIRGLAQFIGSDSVRKFSARNCRQKFRSFASTYMQIVR